MSHTDTYTTLNVARSSYEDIYTRLESVGMLYHYSMDVDGVLGILFGNVLLVPEDLNLRDYALTHVRPKKQQPCGCNEYAICPEHAGKGNNL